MSSGDVCEELTNAKRLIVVGAYGAAVEAIIAAEKAWQTETDLWANELRDAINEINKVEL